MNIHNEVSLLGFSIIWDYTNSSIAGSWKILIIIFPMNYNIDFHTGCTGLHDLLLHILLVWDALSKFWGDIFWWGVLRQGFSMWLILSWYLFYRPGWPWNRYLPSSVSRVLATMLGNWLQVLTFLFIFLQVLVQYLTLIDFCLFSSCIFFCLLYILDIGLL